MAYQCRNPGYSYRYTTSSGEPLAVCPGCGNNLTDTKHGVEIEFVEEILDMDDGVIGHEEWSSRSVLDGDGNLVDVEMEVAAGFHSATRCFVCKEMLINLDDVEEHQTFTPGG